MGTADRGTNRAEAVPRGPGPFSKGAAWQPLEHSIAFQIRRTHRGLAQALQTRLAEHGLTIGAWYFLRVLWEQDGMTQRELAGLVTATAPTTVEQLRAMKARGFVRRESTPEDRRKVRIFLTPQGRALRATLAPHAAELNAAALDGLTDGEVGFLRLVLRRMQENIAALLEQAPTQGTSAGAFVNSRATASKAREAKRTRDTRGTADRS